MRYSDPFPLELCSQRLKAAILAEFNGRPPTFKDMLSMPLNKWMMVPGIGPTLLHELEDILRSQPVVSQVDTLANSDDDDLLNRIEQFQRDLKRLQDDIRRLIAQRSVSKSDADDRDRR